ncbi:MAG: NrsF family protein, partial [Caulobacteraceae bacterium]
MKTAELVRLLAENVTPARRVRVAPLLLAAGLLGAAVAAAVLVFWPAMAPMGGPAAPPPYWMKAGYTLVLAVCGWLMAVSLSRPGGRVGPAALVAVAAVLVLAAFAALE